LLLIRRVRLDPGQDSADPRSRRRRTLHPAQRALPFPELATAGAICAYSFILTSLDVSTPAPAAAVEHWYRHRTTIENLFRDGKHGAALRRLPSAHLTVNAAWMWGALLAASIAGWLHQLTAATAGQAIVAGHGVRGGKAMIATLRWRLIAVPAGCYAMPGSRSCGCQPATACSPRSSPGSAPSPRRPDHPARAAPTREPGTPEPGATPGHPACPRSRNDTSKEHLRTRRSTPRATRGIGPESCR
jgi:Transposase DDE domain group 1